MSRLSKSDFKNLKLREDRVSVMSEIKDNTDVEGRIKSSNKYAIRETSTVD